MRNEKVRAFFLYEDPFEKFFKQQNAKVQRKIYWTIDLIERLARVPEQYLKHLEGTDGLYEIRADLGSSAFRIFCFF